MTKLLRLIQSCLLAVALFLVTGCESAIAPPLVEITELSPHTVEVGERLEVHGAGFPQGRTGRVKLDGTASRPSETPRPVHVEADGTVVTPDRLEVVVRDGFADPFCGQGDHAIHATFRGDVTVSFASTTPGAPPLVGRLRAASFDLLPSTGSAAATEARSAEGIRLLAYLGISAGASTARGLPIEKVAEGSAAARASVLVGDVVTAVDGVHALSVADVAPASARAVEISFTRGDGTEETQSFPLIDYSGSSRIPTEYVPALVLVGLALAILLLLVLPAPPWVVTLEMRLATQLRARTTRAVLSALFGRGRTAALSTLLSAVVMSFALTPYILSREIDGVALLAAATVTLIGSRIAAQRGFVASARALLATTATAIAFVAAIALAIAQIGAIELVEIVRLQGGWPWQFVAARHPSCAVLAIVHGIAIVSILRVREARPQGRGLLFERAGLILASALATTIFFGGWQLPASAFHGSTLVAATLFVAKTWILAGVLLGASRLSPRLEVRELPGIVLKRLVPGLVAAAVLVAASRRIVPSTAIETALGATLTAMTALFTVRVVTRVRSAVSRPSPHVSPSA